MNYQELMRKVSNYGLPLYVSTYIEPISDYESISLQAINDYVALNGINPEQVYVRGEECELKDQDYEYGYGTIVEIREYHTVEKLTELVNQTESTMEKNKKESAKRAKGCHRKAIVDACKEYGVQVPKELLESVIFED